MKKILILCLLCLSVSICLAQRTKKKKKKHKHKHHTVMTKVVAQSPAPVTDTQLCGKVILKAGNFMPSPDRPTPQGIGIARELYVYGLTNVSQTSQQGRFYKDPKTKLVKKMKSDKDGNFCIDLPEGMYSLFSMEEGKGLFANGFDDSMNIFPVIVKKGEKTNIMFLIDYQATY